MCVMRDTKTAGLKELYNRVIRKARTNGFYVSKIAKYQGFVSEKSCLATLKRLRAAKEINFYFIGKKLLFVPLNVTVLDVVKMLGPEAIISTEDESWTVSEYDWTPDEEALEMFEIEDGVYQHIDANGESDLHFKISKPLLTEVYYEYTCSCGAVWELDGYYSAERCSKCNERVIDIDRKERLV